MMRGAKCGSVFNGDYATRVMYQSSSVVDPDTCVSETQSARCMNGELEAYSGTYGYSSCTINRKRYATSSTTCPDPCVSETQTMTCTGGSCGGWSGSYSHSSCTQNGTSNLRSYYYRATNTNYYQCNPYQCNPYVCGVTSTQYWGCYDPRDGSYWPSNAAVPGGIQCLAFCYQTCYNLCSYQTTSCTYGGTSTQTCLTSSNESPGWWTSWSPSGYYGDSSCSWTF
jgi:hypothetical protein